jgi:predicted nucleotidyltransferase
LIQFKIIIFELKNGMKIVDYLYKQGIKKYLDSQPVLKAYLFGSEARGEADDSSDIDILVDLDDSVDLFQFISIKQHLEKILKKTVDLISTNGISIRLKPAIDKEKILIYEK